MKTVQSQDDNCARRHCRAMCTALFKSFSLGKLIQKGYNFFWGPSHEPTIVSPDVPFQVSCDVSQFHVSDRVDHCVPIFRENVSLRYGVPAAPSMEVEPSFPAFDADAGVIEHEREVIPDAIEAFMHDDACSA